MITEDDWNQMKEDMAETKSDVAALVQKDQTRVAIVRAVWGVILVVCAVTGYWVKQALEAPEITSRSLIESKKDIVELTKAVDRNALLFEGLAKVVDKYSKAEEEAEKTFVLRSEFEFYMQSQGIIEAQRMASLTEQINDLKVDSKGNRELMQRLLEQLSK